MTGMGERENVPILWAKVGTWAVEENGLSYNRFYCDPLSYHLLKSDTDHTAPDILLCKAVEFNSWSERVGKFSSLFMGCRGGCDGVFYLQRHQKYMPGSFDFSFSFLKSCQRLFTFSYQWEDIKPLWACSSSNQLIHWIRDNENKHLFKWLIV